MAAETLQRNPQSAINPVIANVGIEQSREKVTIRYGLSADRARLRYFPKALEALPSQDL